MTLEKMFKRVILAVTSIVALLTFSIVAVAFPYSAKCPKDGEEAQRTNEAEEYTHSDKCPEKAPNTGTNNALRASYSHQHPNGPFLETHTFYVIQCLK
jgi:hypothetical protein